MPLLADILVFAAQGLVVFLTFAACAKLVASLLRRQRDTEPSLEVTLLNERNRYLTDTLRFLRLGTKERRALAKERQTEAKAEAKAEQKERPAVYVLDFLGDLAASRVTNLREEITAVIQVAKPGDEVVVRLESPGGGVSQYGLAAAQLARVKEKRLKLTVCVDTVAASGGYMMACVADTILAAPFAIIGSVGVVAQVPNLHRFLEKHDVQFEELTAGQYKRTLSMFGEVTEEGRAKVKDQLEEIHQLFKAFIKEHRPALDVEAIGTGEHWLGTRALELGLVDRVSTSDDYLLSRFDDADVQQVEYRLPANLRRRLTDGLAEAADALLLRVLSRARSLERQG